MVTISLGSVIGSSCSRFSLEWKFVRVLWVLWSSNWGSLGECFPWTIVLRVNITVSIMISVSLGSVISSSWSRDGFEWKLVRVEWILWGGDWSSFLLGKCFPGSIVLRVNITVSVMVTISLGSVISSSWSRDSIEWKLVRIKWILWGGDWSSFLLGKCFPGSIVLRVNITVSVMVTISLGSVISSSCSRFSLEWKFIRVLWVLWSSNWGSLSTGIDLNKWLIN